MVVDDIDMAITHVVRGDDHISNTPKQVLLYGAFGTPLPAFAHVPLILGPDKRRLSKRHGATSVMEYERQGLLSEAMVNFLALLGWSPGSDQELFSRDELVRAFSLEGISSSNAVFNPEKLDWFNGQHIGRLKGDALIARLRPSMEAAGFWNDEFLAGRRDYLLRVFELLKPRLRRLADLAELGRYFFVAPATYDEAAVAKHLGVPDLASHLAALGATLAEVDPFEPAVVEAGIRQVAEARGVKAAALIHPTRIAVTGQAVSPSLFDVVALVGRDETLARLDALRRFVASVRST